MTFFNPGDDLAGELEVEVGDEVILEPIPTVTEKLTSRKLIAAVSAMWAIVAIVIVVTFRDPTLFETAKPVLERAFLFIAGLGGLAAALQYVIDRNGG